MITKITGEAPFQVLATNFTISPSNEGYTLQVSANGEDYSDLFTVSAGVSRMCTGMAYGAFYKCSGNASEIEINWTRQCTDGGFVLKPATDEELGGVKVGEGLTITDDGTLATQGGAGVSREEVEAMIASALTGYETTDNVNTKLLNYDTKSEVNTKLAPYETTDAVNTKLLAKTDQTYTEDIEQASAGIFNLKQNKLSAGQGIVIEDDTISVQGGTGSGGRYDVNIQIEWAEPQEGEEDGHYVPVVNAEIMQDIIDHFNNGDVILVHPWGIDINIGNFWVEYAERNAEDNYYYIYGQGGEQTVGISLTGDMAEMRSEQFLLTQSMDYFQPRLTAGEGITISEDNVISATGGGSGESDKLIPNYDFIEDLPDPIESDFTPGTVMTTIENGTAIVAGFVGDEIIFGPDLEDYYFHSANEKVQIIYDETGENLPTEDIDELLVWMEPEAYIGYPAGIKISWNASERRYYFYLWNKDIEDWSTYGSVEFDNSYEILADWTFYHFYPGNMDEKGRYCVNFSNDYFYGEIVPDIFGSPIYETVDTRHWESNASTYIKPVAVKSYDDFAKYPLGTLITNYGGDYYEDRPYIVQDSSLEGLAFKRDVDIKLDVPGSDSVYDADVREWGDFIRCTNGDTTNLPSGASQYGVFTHFYGGSEDNVLDVYEPADGSGDRYIRKGSYSWQYENSDWKKASAIDSNIPTIKRLTSDEYDAIETKDPNTLYIIVD